MMEQVERQARGKKVWKWIGISVLLVAIGLSVAGQVLIDRAAPILKGRVIETLSTKFDSKVELDGLHVSVLKGLEVSGSGLRIFAPDDVVAAGATKPEISLGQFTFHASLTGLFIKPMHVGTVHVSGLTIDIPPREVRQRGAPRTNKNTGKIKIVVDKIVCDDSRLLIETAKPGKDPKDFELKHIEMHDVGPNDPWLYEATLINAVPKGDIQANGTFGPWVTEDPGGSNIDGHYTFDHADLNTIKGIGGTLSSVGSFNGQLNKIAVDGTTKTPDFSLDTANHPMPLETTFEAVVDGTSGDTYLNKVDAVLRKSHFTTNGQVVNVKGVGHTIDLDVNVPSGRIEDFLQLAVKTQPAIMTGTVEMKAKIHIGPGKQRVAEKLGMKAAYTVTEIHFTNPKWEDKIDMMSLRAEGDPKDAKPGAKDVHSQMMGKFVMDKGELRFSDLEYKLPGADVRLVGAYSLDGNKFDFTGKVRTDAKISQMVASRWKSIMLKPVDPFFHKNGAGAEIPVKISGTRSEPKFGLDLHDKNNPVK